jgi:hypothetical protein
MGTVTSGTGVGAAVTWGGTVGEGMAVGVGSVVGVAIGSGELGTAAGDGVSVAREAVVGSKASPSAGNAVASAVSEAAAVG